MEKERAEGKRETDSPKSREPDTGIDSRTETTTGAKGRCSSNGVAPIVFKLFTSDYLGCANIIFQVLLKLLILFFYHNM